MAAFCPIWVRAKTLVELEGQLKAAQRAAAITNITAYADPEAAWGGQQTPWGRSTAILFDGEQKLRCSIKGPRPRP